MASAFPRHITLLALFAIFVAQVSGVRVLEASVRYSISGKEVRYGDRLNIISSRISEGGVTNARTAPAIRRAEHLTGASNDQGSVFMLQSASGAETGTTIKVNDEVYVEIFKLTYDAPQFWNWRKGQDPEFLLERIYNERTKFKVVALPVPRIYPPVYYYALVSCPGSSCSGLSRFNEGEVSYIQLGEGGTNGDLGVQFQRCMLSVCNLRISMPADT